MVGGSALTHLSRHRILDNLFDKLYQNYIRYTFEAKIGHALKKIIFIS